MKSKETQLNNKTQVKKLEQDYIDDMVKKMPQYIETQKVKIIKEITDYAEKNVVACKWDKEGNPVAYKTKVNPIVINNYFFKPITNINCVEPLYSPEQLGLIYDYYCFLVAEINDKIGYYPPSLTSFCKLSSLTLSTLRNYRNSSDLNMKIIVEKIYDQIGDNNITMSQLGITKERTTMFRLKSENEMIEKEQPKVSINIVDKPDMEQIQERLNKYKKFANKKGGK